MTAKHDHDHDHAPKRATTTKHGKPFAPERGVCTCREAPDGRRVPSDNCPLHGGK